MFVWLSSFGFVKGLLSCFFFFFFDVLNLILFLLGIFFIYISNVIAFPSFPYKKIPILTPLPLLTNPSTPAFWALHSSILGQRNFTGPRASPPIDDQQGHPLLHMQLESLCMFSLIGGLVPGTSGVTG